MKPGAGRAQVAGRYGDDSLIVAVAAPAVDGRATEAALAALAKALGVPRREVWLVSGATSRSKIVRIPDEARADFESLRG